MDVSSLSKSLLAKMSLTLTGRTPPEEGSYSHLTNSELYPHKEKVVDEECPENKELFDLLSGESIEYMGRSEESYLAISNYRFFATLEKGFYSVPLGLVESAEVQHSREELLLLCRDARSLRFTFDSAQKCHMWQERLAESVRQIRGTEEAFAYVHRAYYKDQKAKRLGQSSEKEGVVTEESSEDDGSSPLPVSGGALLSLPVRTTKDLVYQEFMRLGMDLPKVLRITEANTKYRLCPTYPKLFVVPCSLSDEELVQAVKFRMSGRIPAVVWRHPTNGCVIARSSQPLVGLLNWRSAEDEKLLLAISQACASFRTPRPGEGVALPHQNGGERISNGEPGGPLQNGILPAGEKDTPPSLLVMDLRSYTASLGNKAKGGGCECKEYYPNCEIQYKGLPNIHSVRKSFNQLRSILLCDDHPNFLSALEGTQWLLYLCQLLKVSCEVVAALHEGGGRPVLVHCSDGWDRTAQVVSLAELLLDPYYRTVAGFQVLVEREWLAFGHKFAVRCGHGSSEDPNQCCPIFLQWLDCVHQLLRQFPCDFEFNEAFLIKLGHHCYSRLFGTFLGNSAREREEGRVGTETFSLWSLLRADNDGLFTNYLYSSSAKVLYPVPQIRNMLLWKGMYCSPTLIPYRDGMGTPNGTSGSEDYLVQNGQSSPQTPVMPRGGALLTSGLGYVRKASEAASSDDLEPSENIQHPIEFAGGRFSSESSPRKQSEADSDLQEPDSVYHSATEDSCSTPPSGSSATPLAGCVTETLTAANTRTRTASALDTNLLQDAILDQSPNARDSLLHLTGGAKSMTSSTASASLSLSLGVDGLPHVNDVVHLRLREVDSQYKLKLSALQSQLDRARQEVHAHVQQMKLEVGGERGGADEEGAGSQKEEAITPEEQPSSLLSWDCVETGDSQGVRWVPDHAATVCYKCGAEFWTARRKHHCRNCGGVFCSSCANFFCPVPSEQLFSDVRVCEKCYYMLDGHLRTGSSISAPT